MAFSSYSTTPSANTVVGVSVAEGCPPGNINDAIRQLAADGRALSDTVAAIPGTVTPLMPQAAGVFSGTQPIYASEGAVLHNQSSSNASGRVYFLPTGTALPSGANGDAVFFYTP